MDTETWWNGIDIDDNPIIPDYVPAFTRDDPSALVQPYFNGATAMNDFDPGRGSPNPRLRLSPCLAEHTRAAAGIERLSPIEGRHGKAVLSDSETVSDRVKHDTPSSSHKAGIESSNLNVGIDFTPEQQHHQHQHQHHYPTPPSHPPPQRRFDRRYSVIADQYRSLEEVVDFLAQAGLESSNLITGIDFTKSNEWIGKHSFHGRSLHHIGDMPNPYEHAISLIGQTLSSFDDDNLIPCYGFGDAERAHKRTKVSEMLMDSVSSPIVTNERTLSVGQSISGSLESKLKQCVLAVESHDYRTANELLDEVRNSSNARGNSRERLAHWFAEGLEACLPGNRSSVLQRVLTRKISPVKLEKVYERYHKTCPIQMASYMLANQTIINHINDANAVHIVVFGMGFGFQWPTFMKDLSERHGGAPPKLRITAIDMPLPGMYPYNQINHAKGTLEHYARMYNVPFEFVGIEAKWEDVSIESLNLDKDEVLIVNCLSHSGYVSGDMLAMQGPSNTVLKLIQKLKPTAFVHGMVTASSDASSFVPFFKEAWEHYSALFDMVDKTIQDSNDKDILCETFGLEILNIAAYTVPRDKGPETNKIWVDRCKSHGFVQCNVIVDPDRLSKVGIEVKQYNKDGFFIREENKNVLLGWKGRNIVTLSVWKPNQ